MSNVLFVLVAKFNLLSSSKVRVYGFVPSLLVLSSTMLYLKYSCCCGKSKYSDNLSYDAFVGVIAEKLPTFNTPEAPTTTPPGDINTKSPLLFNVPLEFKALTIP